MADYAELQVTTNFSFLRGGSHPDELVMTAAALGLRAIGIADRNSLAGVVRAHVAAKAQGMRLAVGCRLDLEDGPSLLAYPGDRAAYGRLARLISVGRRRAPKGECRLTRTDVADHAAGWHLIVVPPDDTRPEIGFADDLADYRDRFGPGLGLAASHRYRGDDSRRIARLAALARPLDLRLVATNDVHYHHPGRRPLQDVLTAIREKTTLEDAGHRLAANAERHLKPAAEMARLFRDHPEALRHSLDIADACNFSLDALKYEYPEEVIEPGRSAQETLVDLTWQGADQRYPDGVPDRVRAALEHELALIGELAYAPYFLTVHDIVRFARSRDILCQGRGSAANSAVCYVLGITAVDPARADLLFERFVSAARNEPPDIDVDFEHDRREEVIQYIYEKYGRDRAGLTATVIRYRARGAIREVGKVMGLSRDLVGRLAESLWGWSAEAVDETGARELGLDPDDPLLGRTLALARDLIGFPRHLSQHVGGFVITRGLLTELAPVVNAAMAERTTIEWDKDDIEALGMMKVDVLALGMLSCIHRAFDLIRRHHDRPLDLASVPEEDAAVYDMLCRADSLGVFQVESRAQMTMLPRLKPRSFYDLVIEVAIVRPGPIQGDMVHPYLRRRNGEEPVEYPSKALESVLAKTLGVPLFQEQAMKIAIVAAGFTPSEADQLRRAMATFRNVGTIHTFYQKMTEGMVARGYDRAFAERCFKQIEGFGTYGFPESHAASFALLVYVSAWVKCHYPAIFCAALLNSQPMGFYAPAQIVRDAREHGVEVRAVDVNHSDWESTIERDANGRDAVRLGLRQVKGLAESEAGRLVAARRIAHRFPTPEALARASGIGQRSLDLLARADAFRSMGRDRRAAAWAVKPLGHDPLPLFAALDREVGPEPDISLPEMPLGEHVVHDYAAVALTLKAHPLALLRDRLAADRVSPCSVLGELKDRSQATVAGLVLVRQRPGSAKGVIFVTLEDETGIANLVVMPDVFAQYRRPLLGARLLVAAGTVERQHAVIHLRVKRLIDRSARLAGLGAIDAIDTRRTMDGAMARADEVRRPTPDQRQDRAEAAAERRAKLAAARAAFPDGRNFR